MKKKTLQNFKKPLTTVPKRKFIALWVYYRKEVLKSMASSFYLKKLEKEE